MQANERPPRWRNLSAKDVPSSLAFGIIVYGVMEIEKALTSRYTP